MLFGTGLAFYLGKPFIQPQAPRLPAIPFGWWSSVPQVQAALHIPDDLPCLTVVNGHDAPPDQVLAPGDVVAMFPPLAGGL